MIDFIGSFIGNMSCVTVHDVKLHSYDALNTHVQVYTVAYRGMIDTKLIKLHDTWRSRRYKCGYHALSKLLAANVTNPISYHIYYL